MRVLGALVVLASLALPPQRAQNPWVTEWLTDYAKGRKTDVAERLTTVDSLKTLHGDLERLAPEWLATRAFAPELMRRTVAAFALEAAYAKLDRSADAAELIEWGCRQIRRHAPPDAFDEQWHRTAFALLSGAIDPDALEAHVTHVKFQFPAEPRLAFERAVAAEQRTAPFFTGSKSTDRDLFNQRTEAAKRYRDAAKSGDAPTRREALVRLSHVQLALGDAKAAIDALDDAASATRSDPDIAYLAALFRGQALEQLGRTEPAIQAYRNALAVVPRAQSASTALAALLFRHGQRDDADREIAAMLQRGGSADPWWAYWPADFRRAPELIAALRNDVR